MRYASQKCPLSAMAPVTHYSRGFINSFIQRGLNIFFQSVCNQVGISDVVCLLLFLFLSIVVILAELQGATRCLLVGAVLLLDRRTLSVTPSDIVAIVLSFAYTLHDQTNVRNFATGIPVTSDSLH